MSMYINIFLLVACGLQKTKICDVKMTGKSHFKKKHMKYNRILPWEPTNPDF